MAFPDLVNQLISPAFFSDWTHEVFQEKKLSVKILRLDAQHPHIGGNKLYKLYYNLEEAKRQGFTKLITFGGAYSNHLRAMACVGHFLGLQTVGVIRGEKTLPLNSVLSFCQQHEMYLHYVSRKAYREKHTPEFIETLQTEFGDFYLIPEGGSNAFAVKGCTHIPLVIQEKVSNPDWIILATGTGGTSAGILAGTSPTTKVLSISALKGGDFLKDDIQQLLVSYFADEAEAHQQMKKFHLAPHFHEGGYAKKSPRLVKFMQEFYLQNGFALDFIYTGKAFLATLELAKADFFKPHQQLVLIHTGGVFE